MGESFRTPSDSAAPEALQLATTLHRPRYALRSRYPAQARQGIPEHPKEEPSKPRDQGPKHNPSRSTPHPQLRTLRRFQWYLEEYLSPQPFLVMEKPGDGHINIHLVLAALRLLTLGGNLLGEGGT